MFRHMLTVKAVGKNILNEEIMSPTDLVDNKANVSIPAVSCP